MLDIKTFTDLEILEDLKRRLQVGKPSNELVLRPQLEQVPPKILTPYDVAKEYEGLEEIPGSSSEPIIEGFFDSVLGYKANYKDDTAWCAAFMGHCLKKAGYKYLKRLDARSYFTKASEVGEVVYSPNGGRVFLNPKIGDIVVLARNDSDWRGHVMFLDSNIVALSAILTEITGFGGNQSNMVNSKTYKIGNNQTYRFLGIVRPEKA